MKVKEDLDYQYLFVLERIISPSEVEVEKKLFGIDDFLGLGLHGMFHFLEHIKDEYSLELENATRHLCFYNQNDRPMHLFPQVLSIMHYDWTGPTKQLHA